MDMKSNIEFNIVLMSLLGFLIMCQTPQKCDCENQIPDQKWTWSTERFEETVNKVRAGRDLTPANWPNGSKVAVLLSFDVDNETIAWWDGEPSVTDLSRGEYGSRVALKRIINILIEEQVAASFFIPALSLHLASAASGESSEKRQDCVPYPSADSDTIGNRGGGGSALPRRSYALP